MGRIIERIRRRQRKGIRYSNETRNAAMNDLFASFREHYRRPEQVYYVQQPIVSRRQMLWGLFKDEIKGLVKNPLRKS